MKEIDLDLPDELYQGGARRLPNGNTLLTDTVGRRIWEVAPDGDVVVRYKGPAPTFKAFKYSAEQVANLLATCRILRIQRTR